MPTADLVADVLRTAEAIAGTSRTVALVVTESVHRAAETTLPEGVRLERRLFRVLLGTPDQTKGTAASVEEQEPALGRVGR